jgi:acetyl-CoA C-acetyltransferase
MNREIVLAAPVRTPIGRFGGALAPLTAVDLGVTVARAAMERAHLPPDAIGQAIFGHARTAGCGPNPARQVSVRAGIPVEVPAYAINQACLSGLQAVLAAVRAVALGEAEIVLAGGMESMSRVPYLLPDARWGLRMGHREIVDAMSRDGFLDPLSGMIMGETAEVLATRYGISRAEQDAYAALSQGRCERARRAGLFRDEIVPVEVKDGKKTIVVEHDEHPRDGVTEASLAKLAPVFDASGTVTAGNSSGITDGAAAMLVLSREAAARRGIAPWARIVGWRVVGVAPEIMGIGPVPATKKVLEKTGLSLADIDLIEINEAFAAQVIACERELKFDRDRLNLLGGGISLGHPIGMSGARILLSLAYQMRERGAALGLATLCISGGQGLAVVLERT